MNMMTKEIEKVLEKYPLYSQEGMGGDAKVIAHYFTPDSNWDWFVTEGQRTKDGDWEFFGLVHGLEWEWGYFRLSELTQEIPGHMPIEREIYYDPCMLTVAGFAVPYGCPWNLVRLNVDGSETVIDASAEAEIETETWTASGCGQQVLF